MSVPAHPPEGDRVSLERFVAALEAAGVWFRPRGDGLYFRCPLPDHEDVSASGSADWKPPAGGRPGAVDFACHGCGKERSGEIVAALGLTWSDLFDDAPARPPASSPRARRGPSREAPSRSSAVRPAPVAVDKSAPPARVPTTRTTRVFTDAAGVEVARLHRYDPTGPHAEQGRKGFSWEHRGGPRGGWVRGKRCDPNASGACAACRDGRTPTVVPLYRLPEVGAAVAGGYRVWITEGGKNADDLAAVLPEGEVATTAPDGARGPWSADYTGVLAGAAVTVIADRDRPGYEHADQVATQLRAAGCVVRLVRTPLEVEHGDASDHLAAGLELDGFEDVPAAVLDAAAPVPVVDPDERSAAAEGSPAPVSYLHPDRHAGGRGARREPRPARRRTDYGNAERLVDRHGEDLLMLAGQWYVWDGTRFRRDVTGAVERRAKETVRSIYGEAQQVTADSEEAAEVAAAERKAIARHAAKSEARGAIYSMVQLAATEAPVVVEAADELDANPWLLNCPNGTIDLRTGALRAHDRGDRITRSTGVAYDPDAPTPTWDKFLARILPDPATREFLARIIGYSLTGLTIEEKLFLLNGGGSNGKSTCIAMVMAAVGEYAMASPRDLLLSKKPGGIPDDVAALRGARLASVTETEEGALLDETRMKELVTGDTQSARHLYGRFFDFKPQAKYWIATNHRPIIRGSDEAVWRRMVLFPFDQHISDEEKDPYLGEKLRAELPGILAWAVRGCLAWQRDGLDPPAAIRKATEDYRGEQDLIGGFFIERCVQHPRAEAAASALYADYRMWCESAGEHPQSQRRFGQRLRERGFRKGKAGHANTVTWYGLGLRMGGNWEHLDGEDEQPTSPAPESSITAAPSSPPSSTASNAPPADPSSAGSSPRTADGQQRAGQAPCAVCVEPGMFCGTGRVVDEDRPCVLCGKPTPVRSRCGAPRHGDCRPGGGSPPPTSPETPPDGPTRPTRPDGPSSRPGGAERPSEPPRRSVSGGARARTEPRRGAHLYGVLDGDALTVVTDRRPGPSEPLDDAYPSRLAGCVDLARRHNLEALWVHDSGLARLGLPADPDEAPAGMTGWEVHGRGEPDQLELAVPAWLTGSATWAEAESGRELAAALATYEAALGMRWRAAPAATALALLGMLHKRAGARPLIAPTALPPREVCSSERDLSWCRPLTGTEQAARYVIGLDKHGAYPGVMKSLTLGMGDPQHHPEGRYDPRLPGRHRVTEVTPSPDRGELLPDPMTGVMRDGQWRCTETLRYAAEQGARFTVAESYVWPDSAKPLAMFAERVRTGRADLTARADADPAAALALGAVKETYAALGGALASRTTGDRETPGALWRPDWTATVIAKSRVNILRNLDKHGVRPFAANVDELFFVVDSDDPAAIGLPLGEAFGQYGVKTPAVPMTEVADAVNEATRRGRPSPLLKAVRRSGEP